MGRGTISRLRISLAGASLLDVILDQLWRVGLRSTHDEISWRPEVAGGILLLHAREFGEDFFRGLLAHNPHQVTGRGGRWYIDNPLHVFRSDREILQSPGEGDADLWQPF